MNRKLLVFALSAVLICVSIPYSKAAQDHVSYCAPLAGASAILSSIFFLALMFNLVPSLLLSMVMPFILLPIILLALPLAFMALPIVLLLFMIEAVLAVILFLTLASEWYPKVISEGDYGSLSYSFSSSLISAVSFTTLTLGGIVFSTMLLPIGPPIVVFGLIGLAFYVLNAVVFALMRVAYTANVISPVFSGVLTHVRNSDMIRFLSVFDSRPVIFSLTATLAIIAALISALLMPLFAFPAALLSLVSLIFVPVFILISLLGLALLVPSAIVSGFLFIMDMLVWVVEVLSLRVQRSLPENPDFTVGENATEPKNLVMDQLIMKYIAFCVVLGLFQIAEGCMFLMTFFASPLGLIKIAFGAAFVLIPIFGAVITDGTIFYYLATYIAYPVMDAIKRFSGLEGSGLRDAVNSSNILQSPCLFGIGTIFADAFTGFLEFCGETLAVLAVVPVGLSAGMIALSFLPFISVALLDLFMTSMMFLPAGLALSIIFLIYALYSRGRCTIMR